MLSWILEGLTTLSRLVEAWLGGYKRAFSLRMLFSWKLQFQLHLFVFLCKLKGKVHKRRCVNWALVHMNLVLTHMQEGNCNKGAFSFMKRN